uniref:Uncharacterized protein n=1 Tax=Stomoxys calcitrans TaxID=35570 RepID=A0A1I8PSQ7_STOCA
MFYTKVVCLLAAILVIAYTPAATGEGTCDDCLGKGMLELMDKLEQKRDCWFNTNHHILLRLKVINFECLLETFYAILKYNNEVIKEECKREVQLNKCSMSDADLKTICLYDNLRTVTETYNDQEQCNGAQIKSSHLTIANKLLTGVLTGLGKVHPDC